MNEVRILNVGGEIWQNVIFRLMCLCVCVCVCMCLCGWVELFEVDHSRFRWVHGGPKD